MMRPSARSLARIDRHDLLHLAKIAAEVDAGLFARNPQGAGRYTGRLLCRALCQGPALHDLDARNGVKDFDVWSFYAVHDTGHSRIDGEERRITVLRNPGDIQLTRRRSRAVA